MAKSYIVSGKSAASALGKIVNAAAKSSSSGGGLIPKGLTKVSPEEARKLPKGTAIWPKNRTKFSTPYIVQEFSGKHLKASKSYYSQGNSEGVSESTYFDESKICRDDEGKFTSC